MKDILLNIETKEKRLAILKHGRLQDLIIERKENRLLTGNIYRGRVTNILANIQSAFIDINEGENGFIHITDILENTHKFQEMFDMDFEWDCDLSQIKKKRASQTDIAKLLKIDQPVLVQVVKEPIGSKGARLTSNITIAGRFLVLLPNTPHRGVSRKVQDRASRDRLKKLIRSFELPKDIGLICRTASMNATSEELIQEATELFRSWEDIMQGFQKHEDPACLFRESDIVKKALITALDKKFDRLLIDDFKTYQLCRNEFTKYKSNYPLKIEYFRDKTPIFERFGVEGEIERAIRRKIWLPSGGYLFFDKTEAMTTIDVNSGRSKTSEIKTNLEESLVQINMEAAEEIARQLRLRNVGGLVICDFIDMRSRKNQRRVLDRLKEAMKLDSAKCTILGMSEFGLVEMTRQRARESLYQTLFVQCPYCSGAGIIKSHETVAIEIEREMRRLALKKKESGLQLTVHPELYNHITKHTPEHLEDMAKQWKAQLTIETDDTYHLNEYTFFSEHDGQRLSH